MKKSKTMRCKNFWVTERPDGTYKVTYHSKNLSRRYETICKTFSEAGMWVWNMADNHDIGHIVNEKMCDTFGKLFA